MISTNRGGGKLPNSSHAKGARAEREVQLLLRELLGLPSIRRALGAGRQDDMGDITGIPNTVIQVAWREDIVTALREKVAGCVVQQERAHARFGATFLRRRRSGWVVVMTPEQFADLWLAANRKIARPSTTGSSSMD